MTFQRHCGLHFQWKCVSETSGQLTHTRRRYPRRHRWFIHPPKPLKFYPLLFVRKILPTSICQTNSNFSRIHDVFRDIATWWWVGCSDFLKASIRSNNSHYHQVVISALIYSWILHFCTWSNKHKYRVYINLCYVL
jgi:hypothetical protein